MINSTPISALQVFRSERLERIYAVCKNSIDEASTFINKLAEEVSGGVLIAERMNTTLYQDKTYLSMCKNMNFFYSEHHGKRKGLDLLIENHFPNLVDCVSNSLIQSQLLLAKLPLNLDNQISEVIIEKLKSFFVAKVYLEKEKSFSFIELCQNAIVEFTREVAERVLRLYEGLVHELFIMLDRVPSSRAGELFLRKYFIYALLDILEDKYKYHTGQLVCSLIPPTTLPKGSVYEGELEGIVIGGWTRRYFRSKNVTVDPVFDVDGKLLRPGKLLVAQALQNAKRAASAISEDKIIKATLDHQKNMLGLGVSRTPEQEAYVPLVIKKLDMLVKNQYPYHLEEQVPIWRLPSQSACYERKKGGWGTLGWLGDEFADPERICHAGFVKTRVELDEMLDLDLESIPLYSFGFDIYETRQNLIDNLWRVDQPRCTFHRVLEPFKMRGITAGNAGIYHLGRLLQPVLHRYLRDEDGPFRFIGKMHNEEDMRKVYLGSLIYDESHRLLSDKCLKTFIVAGDYKAATDNMDPRLPSAFIQAMRKYTNLSSTWLKVLELTLGSHVIEYGDLPEYVDKKTGVSLGQTRYEFLKYEGDWKNQITQSWGQLMGSPTSFPVLCLVNAAMFWASTEIFENKKISWRDVLIQYRPLFNGDDISFLSNIDHYRIWEDVCTGCGLALSPGKNYITDKFININSTCFLTKYERVTDYCKRLIKVDQAFIPNAGLLKGQAKVISDTRDRKKEKTLEESLSPTCDQLTECLKSATPEQAERCVAVFHHELGTKLRKSKKSWILPRHLGGLGLPFGSVNEAQLSVATALLEKYRDLSDVKYPLLFKVQGDEYWNQIRERFRHMRNPPFEERRTKVLFPEDTEDMDEILYEVPSFATLFLTTSDHVDELFVEWMQEKEEAEKKKERLTGKKRSKYAKRQDPEEPYVKYRNSIKRKCPWDSAKNRDEIISRLKQTRLSRSGLTRECYIDVSRPEEVKIEIPDPSNLWENRTPEILERDVWFEYALEKGKFAEQFNFQ